MLVLWGRGGGEGREVYTLVGTSLHPGLCDVAVRLEAVRLALATSRRAPAVRRRRVAATGAGRAAALGRWAVVVTTAAATVGVVVAARGAVTVTSASCR